MCLRAHCCIKFICTGIRNGLMRLNTIRKCPHMVRLDLQELRYRAAGAVLSLPATLSIFLLLSEDHILQTLEDIRSHEVAANVFNLSCQFSQCIFFVAVYIYIYTAIRSDIKTFKYISSNYALFPSRAVLFRFQKQNRPSKYPCYTFLLIIGLLTCLKSLFMISHLQF